jgi:regulator of protease activity HflC (stomatin/prohibitin superfamily)
VYGFLIVLPFVAMIALFIALAGIKVCQEYQRGVIFRLGRFSRLQGPGLFRINPFVESVSLIDLRTRTVSIEPQEAITSDSVTVRVNAVLYYKVSDPEKAIIQVANFKNAINQAALTTLRSIIGQNQLDQLLKERDRVNETIRSIIDEMSDPWGIKVVRVEIKGVEIPVSMQRAMAREAEAQREKSARVIKAEAERESSRILAEASEEIAGNPAALELRRMQMISEVGSEENNTTIVLFPTDFVNMAGSVSKLLGSPDPGEH